MSGEPEDRLKKFCLQFIWICDCSGSMSSKKIESLDFSLKEATRGIRDWGKRRPNVKIEARAIAFGQGVHWVVAEPTDIEDFFWPKKSAGGFSGLGEAIDLLCDALEVDKMLDQKVQKVLVLVSDGQFTDDYKIPLQRLLHTSLGSKSIRIGIGIGEDVDTGVLQEFMGCEPEKNQPLNAEDSAELIKFLEWPDEIENLLCDISESFDGH